jgi:hypothetical protein
MSIAKNYLAEGELLNGVALLDIADSGNDTSIAIVQIDNDYHLAAKRTKVSGGTVGIDTAFKLVPYETAAAILAGLPAKIKNSILAVLNTGTGAYWGLAGKTLAEAGIVLTDAIGLFTNGAGVITLEPETELTLAETLKEAFATAPAAATSTDNFLTKTWSWMKTNWYVPVGVIGLGYLFRKDIKKALK